MSKFATANVQKILPYTPGEQPQHKMVKLNTNENPFNIDKKVQEVILQQVEKLHLYPDPNSSGLTQAIADYYQLDANQVFVGNGSDEVLAHIFQAFFANDEKSIAIPDISYSFYKVYASLYKVAINYIPLTQDFSINIEDYQNKASGIILPNPNAPTGKLLNLKEISKLLQANSQSLVVIDEAYIDFGGESSLPLLQDFDNLIIVQTFSKSRSLAGLRVGFALANPDIIADLNKVKNSFNSYPLDTISQAVATYAIKDKQTFINNCNQIIKMREEVTKSLMELDFSVLESRANFVFAKHKNLQGAFLLQELKAKNILVRNFSEPNRIADYLRISIGTNADNQALITALKQILASVEN